MFSGKKRSLFFWIVLRALNAASTPLIVPVVVNVMIDCFEGKQYVGNAILILSSVILGCLILSYYIYVYSDAWMIKTMYEFQESSLLETFKIHPHKRRSAYNDGEAFCIINNGAWGMIQIWMKIFRVSGPLLSLLVLMLFSLNYSILFFLLIVSSIMIDFIVINFQTKKIFNYREESLVARGEYETTLKYVLNNVEFLSMNNIEHQNLSKHQKSRGKYWSIETKIQLFDSIISVLSGIINVLYRCISYLLMEYCVNGNFISSGQLGASDSVIQNARTEAKNVRSQIVSTPNILVPVEKVRELLSLQNSDKNRDNIMNNNTENAIEFIDVEIKLDNKIILHNINFTILSGEKVAIIGKNGAGKSTLFKAILNIIPKNSGKIMLFGKENTTLNDNLKHFCSYVPAQQILFSQSLKNNVLMGSENEKSVLEVRQALEKSSFLSNKNDIFIDRNASTLSGGEAQRVSVARSIIGEKKLFFWDEPTSALDEKNAEIVMNNISHKYTMLFTTHKPIELSYSDRVIFIENGTIKCDMETTKFLDTKYYLDWLGNTSF